MEPSNSHLHNTSALTTESDLARTAIEYAGRGWSVIPLHSPSKHGCSCGRTDCSSPAKHPRTAHGLKDASCDAQRIREWWAQWPDANIGILTGPESGFLVLDIDGEQGLQTLNDFEGKGWRLPATYGTFTGRGRHLYFECPPALRRFRSSAGKVGPGLDVRAGGGYVVAPPSHHSTGDPIRWLDPAAPIQAVPQWLLKLLETISTPAQQREPIPASEIGVLTEGRRNDGLFRFACSLRRKGSIGEEIESALRAANTRRCRPPLPDTEIRTIAASAANFPIGGPDPLQTAWEATEGDYPSRRERFIALVRQLQSDRPEQNYRAAAPTHRGADASSLDVNRPMEETGRSGRVP